MKNGMRDLNLRILVFEMSAMMDIIKQIIHKMTLSNPFGMVLKGGTALAYHHLDWHRESEDLDLDAPYRFKENIRDVQEWFKGMLDELVTEGHIHSYDISKAAFSNTERYHMKIKLKTYKEFYTKVDIDFKDILSTIEYEGELGFYSTEHMLISKLNTYKNRGTLKDIYDISYLLKIVNTFKFSNRSQLTILVADVIERLENEDLNKIYSKAFDNIDLRFKSLKQKDIPTFRKRTLRDLYIFNNQLVKDK